MTDMLIQVQARNGQKADAPADGLAGKNQVLKTPGPILPWEEFTKRLLGHPSTVLNKFVQKLPRGTEIKKAGLQESMSFYGGYFMVICRLKAEGVLDGRFNPKLRSLEMAKPLKESPRGEPEGNAPAGEGFENSAIKTPEPAAKTRSLEVPNDGFKISTIKQCEEALYTLHARPHLKSINTIIRVGEEDGASEQERRNGRLASALLQYANLHEEEWKKFVRKLKADEEARQRASNSYQEAKEMVRDALYRMGKDGIKHYEEETKKAADEFRNYMKYAWKQD